MPPPPPPPPPPGPPPPPAPLGLKLPKSAGSAAPNRNALLSDIQSGTRLKKVDPSLRNDRSAAIVDPKAQSSGPGKGGPKRPQMPNGSDSNNSSSVGPAMGPPMGLGGIFAGGMPKLKPVGGAKSSSNGPSPRDDSPSTASESEPPPPPKSKPPGRWSPVNTAGVSGKTVNHNNNTLNGVVNTNGEVSRNGTVGRKFSDTRPPPPPQKSNKVLQDVEARRKSVTQMSNDISPDSSPEESPSNGVSHNHRFQSGLEMRSGGNGILRSEQSSQNGAARKPNAMEPPPPPDPSRKPSIKTAPPPLPSSKPVGTPQSVGSKTIGHGKTSRPVLPPYGSAIAPNSAGGAFNTFNMRTRASSDENLVPPPPPRDNRPTINKSQTQASLTNGSRPPGAQTPPSARRGVGSAPLKPSGPPPPPPPIAKPQGPPPPPPPVAQNFGTIGPKRPLPPTPSVVSEFPTPVPVAKQPAHNGGFSQQHQVTPPSMENPPPPPKRGSSQSAYRESPAGSDLEKRFEFEDIWNLPAPDAFRNLPKRFVRQGADRGSGRKAAPPLPPSYNY